MPAIKKFRITHRHSGIQYTASYATTIKGAVKVARSKGFFVRTGEPADNWNTQPFYATIERRTNRNNVAPAEWELIATVTADAIKTEDPLRLPSVLRALAQIDVLKAYYESAGDDVSKLNAIADRTHTPTNR